MTILPSSMLLAALALLGLPGCVGSAPEHLSSDGSEVAKNAVDPIQRGGNPAVRLGQMRLKSSVCQGIDLEPETKPLTETHLIEFLKRRGYRVDVARARGDLVYLDVSGVSLDRVRLRVALLDAAGEAGRDLHEAILQHGEGSWGVHRANVAVLAPIGGLEDVIAFAVRSKLACWGVLTVAGRDDTFVIPGGYAEL